MDTMTPVDPSVDAFTEKVLLDYAGASACVLGAIGDTLGLFKDLAAKGPATSGELAVRAGVDERYTREWLAGMHAAGYLAYQPTSGRYELPAAHIPALAEEAGLFFFGAAFQDVVGTATMLDQIVSAFRSGGGVPMAAFPPSTREVTARYTATWFEHRLIQEWLPAMPDVAAKLEEGATLADVGCGRGHAILKLAEAYPRSRFIGYDIFEPDIAHATAAAARAGLGDRVRFKVRDAAGGLPGTYDVVTTFDVLHDAVDPRGILRAIHAAIAPNGRYVCVDVTSEDRPEDNVGPLATIKYAASLGYCLTVSLAEGGEGLGTLGLPESKLRKLASEVGFTQVRLAVEDPFNSVYELIP